MTRDEWKISPMAVPMLDHLSNQAAWWRGMLRWAGVAHVSVADGRYRTFICECARLGWELLDEQMRESVVLCEAWSRGVLPANDVYAKVTRKLGELGAPFGYNMLSRGRRSNWKQALGVSTALSSMGLSSSVGEQRRAEILAKQQVAYALSRAFNPFVDAVDAAQASFIIGSALVSRIVFTIDPSALDGLMTGASTAMPDVVISAQNSVFVAQAEVLRDVIGDPFMPLDFKSSWLSQETRQLASRMALDGDFAEMAELRRLLVASGCSSDQVLSHLEISPHCRGCWVIDKILHTEIQ